MKYTVKVEIKAGQSSSSFKQEYEPEFMDLLDKIMKQLGVSGRAEAFLAEGDAAVKKHTSKLPEVF